MLKKDFKRILRDYLSRKATREEKRMIDSWYTDLGRDVHASPNSPKDEAELEERYWSAISAHVKADKGKRINPGTGWYAIGMAASVLLVLALVFVFLDNRTFDERTLRPDGPQASLAIKKVVYSGEVTRIIILPDGSEVILQPQSRLEYPASFNASKREVSLEGEGFFSVTPNVNRPFLVYANTVVTKVVGTTFTIKASRAARSVTVAVMTGKVSVYTSQENKAGNQKSEEIILTPNQQIVYNKDNQKLSRMIVDTPQLIRPAEVKRMRFEAAPVSEILEAIEKVYGLEIVFDEAKLSSCTLTTSISDGGLYNRLDIICAAIGATYTVKENQIVVEGTGCSH